MKYMSRINMERRKALRGIGAALGTGLIAGCTGGEPADDTNDGSMDDSTSESVDFPEDDMLLVVPHGAGGGYDTYSRVLAQQMPEHLPNSVQINVQNMPGAGAVVGTEFTYDSEPDGYTFQICHFTNLLLNQISLDVDYDVEQMTWYPQAASENTVITVGTNTDINTWDELVTAIQSGEARLGASSPRATSPVALAGVGHLSGQFSARDVMDNIVVYDSTPEIIQGVIRGDIQIRPVTVGTAQEFVESGDLRPILEISTEEEPSDSFSDVGFDEVDTLRTANIEGADAVVGFSGSTRCFAGPPGVPEDRANIIRDAMTETIQSDEYVEAMEGRPVVYADSSTVEGLVSDSFEDADVYSEVLEIADEVQD